VRIKRPALKSAKTDKESNGASGTTFRKHKSRRINDLRDFNLVDERVDDFRFNYLIKRKILVFLLINAHYIQKTDLLTSIRRVILITHFNG